MWTLGKSLSGVKFGILCGRLARQGKARELTSLRQYPEKKCGMRCKQERAEVITLSLKEERGGC